MLTLLPKNTLGEAMEHKRRNLSTKNYLEMLDSIKIYIVKSLMC